MWQSDNLVLCKVYKRRVTGKTYDDALDEENTSISSIANNETEVSIGSCNSAISNNHECKTFSIKPTLGHSNGDFNLRLCLSFTNIFILSESQVSNGSEQMLSDVSYTECEETNHQFDRFKEVEVFLMDEKNGNDPSMFPEEELNRRVEELMEIE